MKLKTNISGVDTEFTNSLSGKIYKDLSVLAVPSSPASVVSKGYLDSVLDERIASTGDIVFKPYRITPDGYFKCNGSLLDKTVYPGLFAVIGYTFTNYTQPGNGQPYQHQYEFNYSFETSNSWSWYRSTTIPATNAYSTVIATKNRVYLLGRYNGASYTTGIYTATINTDGSLSGWSTASITLPVALLYSQAIVTNNYVYMLGGYNGSAKNNVIRSAISSTGTINTWESYTSLPFTSYSSKAIVTKNRVYLIAGYINNSISNKVYTAPIDSTGNIGTWVEGPSLPISVFGHTATVIKNKLYVIGGVSEGTGVPLIYIGHIESDGTISGWSKGTSLPVSIYYTSLICTRNRVYLIGGVANGSVSSAVYGADINTDGSLDTWQLVDNLPDTMYGSSCLLTGGGLYVIGGYVNGNISTRVNTVDVTGGLSDYSYYYSAAVVPVMGDTFALPDYTTFEATSLYAYIKY